MPAAIKTLFEKTGVKAAEIAHFILPCPFAKLDQTIAKQCGIDPAKVRDNLASNVGDSGSAHALLMLVHALEQAKPGDKILVAQFGQGCDALLFEVTPTIADLPKRNGVTGSLARRKEETNYLKYLGFNGLIELEKGMRAEVDKRTALSVLYRKNDMLLGLVGGKCRVCGTAQFPKSRICVNPNCKAVDSQDDYGFSEQRGHGAVVVGGLPHLFDGPAQPLRHDHLRRWRTADGRHHRCRAGPDRHRREGAHELSRQGPRREARFRKVFLEGCSGLSVRCFMSRSLQLRDSSQPATLAIGAVAVGALALGALAVGFLAVNWMFVRRAFFEKLEIGDLRVGRLRIRHQVEDEGPDWGF